MSTPTFGTPAAKDNPWFSNLIAGASVSVGAEAAHARNVSIQLQRSDKLADLHEAGGLFAYLSDDAGGQSIAASAPSSGWAIGTDGLLIPVVANKAAYLISEADGDIDITITEASAKDFWLVLVLPGGSLNITKVSFAG